MSQKKEITVDEVVEGVKKYIQQHYGVEVNDSKVRGLAFSTLKEAGVLTTEDKYKTYEHVDKMLNILNEGLGGDVFTWEDIEHFTGNLFYCMRAGTRRPIDNINDIIKQHPNNKRLHTDLMLLIQEVKKNMHDTWKYLEKTQQTGAGMIVNKFLKYLMEKQNEKNVSRPKKRKALQKETKR